MSRTLDPHFAMFTCHCFGNGGEIILIMDFFFSPLIGARGLLLFNTCLLYSIGALCGEFGLCLNSVSGCMALTDTMQWKYRFFLFR